VYASFLGICAPQIDFFSPPSQNLIFAGPSRFGLPVPMDPKKPRAGVRPAAGHLVRERTARTIRPQAFGENKWMAARQDAL
jgi:hypothetical protein